MTTLNSRSIVALVLPASIAALLSLVFPVFNPLPMVEILPNLASLLTSLLFQRGKRLKKEEVPLAKFLPPVFVCMGCTREREKAAEIRMSSIDLSVWSD